MRRGFKHVAAAAFACSMAGGFASAGDFSTTLHYPDAPAKSRPAVGLDRVTTGSILKKRAHGRPSRTCPTTDEAEGLEPQIARLSTEKWKPLFLDWSFFCRNSGRKSGNHFSWN